MTAMARRIACLLLALGLVGALSVPSAAWADGDPASDFLLAQNVFYPFQPPVAASLQRSLNAETAATQHAGLPLKVALIHSPADLGAIPSIFGKPQGYANFLDREISFNGPQPLLVVMPDGYGVAGLPAARVAGVVRSLRPPAGSSSDDLARAAAPAILRIAAADGHPIPSADAQTSAGTGGGSPTLIIALALAVVAVIAAAGLLTVRRRQAARGRPASARRAARARR
jgi:hypothetical protein